MAIGIGSESTPQMSSSDIKSLEELMKNRSLDLLIELVEHRYRAKRNKFVISVLSAALSLSVASAGLLWRMYEDMPGTAQQTAVAVAGEDRQREYTERLERARTRQQFALTSQSFNGVELTLPVDQSELVRLETGQRRQYLLDLTEEGPYRIVMDDRTSAVQESPDVSSEFDVPFEPVMFLYQLREGELIARPVCTNIGERALEFGYESGLDAGVWSYFLEVESLMSDAGSFTLTLERMSRPPQPCPTTGY